MSKSLSQCDPSQKGLFFESPHRHSVRDRELAPWRGSAFTNSISPRTTYGPCGITHTLASSSGAACASVSVWLIAPDGQRFLMITRDLGARVEVTSAGAEEKANEEAKHESSKDKFWDHSQGEWEEEPLAPGSSGLQGAEAPQYQSMNLADAP